MEINDELDRYYEVSTHDSITLLAWYVLVTLMVGVVFFTLIGK